jgi:hypothetical protein
MIRSLTVSHQLLFITFLILACALRFIGMAQYSFDYDEVFSLRAAQESWGGMYDILTRDVSHPPLSYVLLKLWLYLVPPTEGWVRVLPATFGAATLVPLYLLTRQLRLGFGATALVLCLFAANGEMISFAQFVRMFSMLQFWSVMSIFFFIRYLMAETQRPALFWWLTAVNLLMVYTHYWGWMIVLAQLVIGVTLDRRIFQGLARSASLVALLFLPWVLAVAAAALEKGSAAQQIAWMGEPRLWSAAWLFIQLQGYADIPGSPTLTAAICIAAALLLAVRPVRESERFPAWGWAVLLGLPVVLTLGLGFLSGHSVWGTRHMLIVGVPYFMLVAAACERLPWKGGVPVVQGVLIAWAVVGGVSALSAPERKAQWQSLVETIDAASPDGPVVVRVVEPYTANTMRFYADRHAPRVSIVLDENGAEEPPDGRFWLVYRPGSWTKARSPDDMLRASGRAIERTVGMESRADQRGWKAFALRVAPAA